MLDECLMTEECPGYDRDRRVCLLRPDDCEFAPAALAGFDAGAEAAPADSPDRLSSEADLDSRRP